MTAKAFRVLLFLYEEKVTCWASGLFGFFNVYLCSINFIREVVRYFTTTFRQLSLNNFSGRKHKFFESKENKLDHTTLWRTPNLANKSSSSKPTYKRQK